MYNSHVHSVRNIKKKYECSTLLLPGSFFFSREPFGLNTPGGDVILPPPVIVSGITYAYRCVSCVLLRLLCGEVYVDKAYVFRERCYIKRRTLHVER